MQTQEMTSLANKLRIDLIKMLRDAKTGHPGGALSALDILTVLYFDKMNVRADEPRWEDRDRFILSKGHAVPALYAVLAEKGYFPKEKLATLRAYGSILQGHPDMKSTPGIDMSSGALGQGLSAGVGMALAGKLQEKAYRVYVMLGDGELQEGQVWEAVMSAAQYKLDHLIAIVDYNGLQINGTNEEVMNIAPLAEKFAAFNWNVIKLDGHDMNAISAAIDCALTVKEQPTVLIAKTVKGKGVSFMENNPSWHGKTPNEKECALALAELEGM